MMVIHVSYLKAATELMTWSLGTMHLSYALRLHVLLIVVCSHFSGASQWHVLRMLLILVPLLK